MSEQAMTDTQDRSSPPTLSVPGEEEIARGQVLPCPFCGGPARTFPYNGTDQATCDRGYVECAGSDVMVPIAMWNTRAPAPIHEASPPADAVVEALRDWLLYAEVNLSEFDTDEPCPENLCTRCRSTGCIKEKIDAARAALTGSTAAGGGK